SEGRDREVGGGECGLGRVVALDRIVPAALSLELETRAERLPGLPASLDQREEPALLVRLAPDPPEQTLLGGDSVDEPRVGVEPAVRSQPRRAGEVLDRTHHQLAGKRLVQRPLILVWADHDP